MKILWFEVTPPGAYLGQGWVIGGWQDSLERIIKQVPGIELSVAFEVAGAQPTPKKIDGVTYYPIALQYTKNESKKAKISWNVNAEKLVPKLQNIVDIVKPDIIHVFGTEWPFGLIAEKTNIPVVIHIQGAIAPYNNAMFPPGYNFFDKIKNIGWKHPQKIRKAWQAYLFDCSRLSIEKRAWKCVSHYMGRTHWDKALSEIMHPGREYFHVEEALRKEFTTTDETWQPKEGNTIRLISTGCSNFWKGPDMLLKTAKILTELQLDFEWNVAGHMPDDVKQIVEKKTKAKYEDCHVNFLGFIQPKELSKYLINSTMYVHTAYIENSPNSICEAQCMGVPIISTNVGGIASLVRNHEHGILVPANDPWQMAYEIKELAKDKELMKYFSKKSIDTARKRHSDENIRKQLLKTYETIIAENQC